jgi:uncharacterized membrane-anchored protein
VSENLNEDLNALIDNWCARKEYTALSLVLPTWLSNNGLTDGWAELRDALKHAHVMLKDLPIDERDLLKKFYVQIDYLLADR